MSITNRKIGRSDIHEVPQLLREMRLTSMAKELEKKLEDPTSNIFTVGEEFVDLALAEYNSRCTNKVNKYIKKAQLKISGADIQDLYNSDEYDRQMNESLAKELSNCNWIKNRNNLIITGSSGTGKTWIGCAIAVYACEMFMNVCFYSISDLILELKTLSPEALLKKLKEIRKLDLLILDDIGYMPYDLDSCRLFFQVLDTRYKAGSTMLISNFTVNEWYDLFADQSYAEATLSRCVEKAYRLPIEGEDLRKRQDINS